ncbi:MAG: caspase family protein, partial [Candidatus Methanoperedens sp.]|nr:caspase family protein [Candidatus Methanoperedens sp.]
MLPNSYNPFYINSWAIVVGINVYQLAPSLSYAINDAKAIADLLVSKLDFPEGNIHRLLNDGATRLGILKALSEVREEATNPDDRVIFFFAGHGYTETGTRGQVGFLVPFDGDPTNLGTLIYFDELVKTAELILAK